MRRAVPAMLLLVVAAAAVGAEPDWERVLHPRALGSSQAPSTIQALRARFADPPAEFRPAPLWVWNDELSWPRLEQMLHQYKKLGFGGAFVHPRPGLMTEYLGEEWFDLWRRSLELASSLGLKLHIYDENSYPAGFSGGHVPALDPTTTGHVVTYRFVDEGDDLPWSSPETVAIYAVERDSAGTVTEYRPLRPGDAPPAGQAALVAAIEPTPARGWTGGFPYVDLTNPHTTELFLETTYEAYRRHFGNEFGRSIHWAFSDEPELPKLGSRGLPLSFRILSEFRRRRGYDLAGHIPSLFWDTGDYRRVRFDYWELIHDLMLEAFFEPMFSWCDDHNLQWTGHWWEHNWPYPWLSPSDMSFYAFEHTPGIDLLGFQVNGLDAEGVETHMLFTIKQVASAANQLGRPRVLSETYGGYGWRATFEQFKRAGDWEITHGVNLVNQHLSYVTTRGARKRDWPQSFSDAAAWWPYYRLHAGHIARLSLAAAAGKVHNRVLVLNPTTSGYLLAARAAKRNKALENLRSGQGALVQYLSDHQVDYDLGDEYLLEWFGRVEDGQLVVGEQRYAVVVWPRGMKNVRKSTLRLLGQFVLAGGKLLALGEPASLIDGRPARINASRWQSVASHDDLLAAIRDTLQPRIRFEEELPRGVGFAQRDLADGARLLILNNAGPAPVVTTATVSGASLERWDTLNGRVEPYPASAPAAGTLRFPVRLAPAETLVLTVRDEGAPLAPAEDRETVTPLRSRSWKARAESPNVLVLDFCDLSVSGRELRDVLVMQAARTIFREHGFAADPWEMAVQFRTNVLDRNHFGIDSGFTASFHFDVDNMSGTKDLELAVEAPELYTIEVNGRAIDFSDAGGWLDPHLRRAPIASAVRKGRNTITVSGKPFDVRMSLEAVYLLGDFRLKPAGRGFRIAAPRRLKLGAWSRQGRPFDTGTVLYSSSVELPEKGILRVELGPWRGAVAEVLLDGKRAAVLGWPPYQTDTPLAAGRHEVAIRVVGTPRNLYGPFHDPRPTPRILWPGHWTLFASIKQPPGASYEVEPYGLLATPQLSLVK